MLHQGEKKLYDFMSIILFVLVDILNVYNTVTMIFWILLCLKQNKLSSITVVNLQVWDKATILISFIIEAKCQQKNILILMKWN